MNTIPAVTSSTFTADQKALQINLNPRIYGTIVEIGAGQEVARHFFRVGGAAGTIAKTMSAYDMVFSDEIYGKVGRYVSRERLATMLNHEYALLLERLSTSRGAETCFFAFADTVTARNYKGTNECHGWMGVRFQTEPQGAPNDIVLHVRMTDRENVVQQQALGIIGVNLLYGAYHYRDNPDTFITSLLDELSIERIEVDMVEFSGPAFAGIDNRLLSLKLVQLGLTNAVLFAPNRRVLQPSEVLRKRPILVARGSYRPVTHANLDMMSCARAQFEALPSANGAEPLALFEISLNNLLTSGTLDHADFLARADILSTIGYDVLISDYSEHYRLTAYLRRYTSEAIGMVMGIETLLKIFDEQYYQALEGGMLEALGRLFQKTVKIYTYPMHRAEYLASAVDSNVTLSAEKISALPTLVSAEHVQVSDHLRHLYKYLREGGYIEPIEGFNPEYLSIASKEVLVGIQNGGTSWEAFVPTAAAQVIKERGFFGYTSQRRGSSAGGGEVDLNY